MLWAFPCGPKLSDTGCGFPALWFANSTDFLHTFNFSLQIRFLWLLFPQTHRYDWSIKVYTLKLIVCVLGDIELFLTTLGSGVQCHRLPRWFGNQAGGWNPSYLLSPSWIHVFGMLALHFNTLLTFFVACRLKHYLIKFPVNFFY
jgi:hypothetical protein